MSKKIIAFCCVLVLVVTCFVACGKKYSMITIGASEYPVVTDAEGNTEVDGEGKIAVYVTDAKGNTQLDAQGNPQKNFFDFPDVITNGLTLETPAYKFTMPDGWTLMDTGVFFKKGTNEKCYVRLADEGAIPEDQSFDMIVDKNIVTNRDNVEKMKETYPDTTMDVKIITLSNGTEGKYIAYMIKDETGKIIHYAVSMYYSVNGEMYGANYMCDSGIGYDEEFDFYSLLSSNLIIK